MQRTILVADDDPAVCRMVARVLESAGYLVVTAGTSQEAILKFGASQPQLVLLDVKLPDQEGRAFAEAIQKLDPTVPIVVITAFPNQSEDFARRGIGTVMEKPLDLPLLLEIIDNLIKKPKRQPTDRRSGHLSPVS